MNISTRKELHNELIEDFRNLEYFDDNIKIFHTVEKFIAKVSGYPSCEIIPSEAIVNLLGITSDNRLLGFRSIVRDHIEADRAEDQTEFERKIDRLSDIEDVILGYLEQVPHPLEHAVTDVHMIRIDVLPTRYFYEDSTEGISIYQSIDFNLVVNKDIREF
jgi:hypothetical protein